MAQFEEGQEFSFDDFPVYTLKSFSLNEGTASGFDVVLAVFTLIDPDTMEEEGIIFVLPSEDSMNLGTQLRGIGATITPMKKQLERALAAQEENTNG